MNKKTKIRQFGRLQATGRLPTTSRRSRLLPAMLAMVLLLALTGCAAIGATPTGTTPAVTTSDGTTSIGNTERNFTLTDVQGSSFTLDQTFGKKVYIKFWATWCPICLSGLSDLEQFSKDKSTDTDVVVLTIVSPEAKGEMNREDFITWYNKQGYTFPVLLDDGGQIARLYEVRGYPTSVFIDTTGKIVRSQPGHIAGAEIDILLDSIM